MRKCPKCRTPMQTARQNHRYAESGLPNVVLVGVEVSSCPGCGERVISIPRLAQLHRAIALELIRQPGRLTPQGIRFLRKHLGFATADFAKRVGVAPETVSRWESESSPQEMGPVAERLLRLMVALGQRVADYSLDTLATIADEAKVTPLRMAPDERGWHTEAA
jgi:putative zinc finger/helix-turn-helix YgiT family protein